jgi:YVTN family beta-propeller protein
MNRQVFKWAVGAVLLLASCSKDDEVLVTEPVKPTKGAYVLSEGPFGASNATKLAYYDYAAASVNGDIFKNNNGGTELGDLGNDALIYGSKMYVVMGGTGNVTVINAADAKLIKRIDFKSNGISRQPRYATAANGKVYVSSYDNSVSVIDTVSLTVTKNITVGSNPEGLAISGNYLYVANSGGLNYPNFDSTVSVVDLSTQAEIKKIKVGINPSRVQANSKGDVYVTYVGDYGSVTAGVAVISSSSNTLKSTLGSAFKFTCVRIVNDMAYFYNNYAGNTVLLYNTATNTIVRNNAITDGTTIQATYGVDVDPSTDELFIADGKDYSSTGSVTCFDKEGKKKYSFSTSPGVLPNKILFIK